MVAAWLFFVLFYPVFPFNFKINRWVPGLCFFPPSWKCQLVFLSSCGSLSLLAAFIKMSPQQYPWSTGPKSTQQSRFLPTQGLKPELHLSVLAMPLYCSHPPLPSSTYHLVTCPLPGTSAAGSAGSGCGWCGRSGSSFDEGRSRLHCSADSSWRSPAQEKGHRNTSG